MSKLNFSLAVISIVLFVLLVAAVVAGGYFCVSLGLMAEVLKSPASTSNLTIDQLIITTDSVNVTLHGFTAEVNSKFIDLMVLAGSQ